VQVKAALSVILTIVIYPLVHSDLTPVSAQPIELLLLILKEVIVGLIIGFFANIIFYGIQMAGQIIGIQIGFGIINIIDPYSNIQISLVGQLYYLVALLIFLAIDGHHFLLRALVFSYEQVPLASAVFPAGLTAKVNLLSALVFDIALRVAAPMLTTLFITDVALGFMARVAPQMNVFIVGFPLKIGLGLLVLTLTINYFPYIFGKIFNQFQNEMILLVRLFGSS
jgi:flagellar biosynthetic protein FliR